jgi:hypothetical protein
MSTVRRPPTRRAICPPLARPCATRRRRFGGGGNRRPRPGRCGGRAQVYSLPARTLLAAPSWCASVGRAASNQIRPRGHPVSLGTRPTRTPARMGARMNMASAQFLRTKLAALIATLFRPPEKLTNAKPWAADPFRCINNSPEPFVAAAILLLVDAKWVFLPTGVVGQCLRR